MDVLGYLILSSVICILMLVSVCNAQKQLKVQLDDSKNYPAQKPEAPPCLVLPYFLSENTTAIYVFLDKRFPPLLLKAKPKSHSLSYIQAPTRQKVYG
jgi:hypothetical protein